MMTTKRLDHYPDTDESDVTAPVAKFIKPGRPVVTMSNDYGHINSDASEVLLKDNVRVVRNTTKNQKTMVTTAPDLTIYPDAETANTKSPVHVVQGKSWLKDNDLQMDNATMNTILESRITDQFANKHKKH